MSLAPAVDPVVSPSGTIYSREAIIKYLLAKTKEIKRARKAYKRDVAAAQLKEQVSEPDMHIFHSLSYMKSY